MTYLKPLLDKLKPSIKRINSNIEGNFYIKEVEEESNKYMFIKGNDFEKKQY